ncbi:MAG: bifunctional folylpolyglutamate synthase/dihydrofolate synthase [Myxococcales bacterium]|nr:bifunctional folylpolyglutamate synthase/dihydrofolate synthase [Myxococcales bacterium]
MKLGLERIHAALEALGHPEQSFPALHVAGTNGKGSTCAFAEACLRAQGYRVGLYTSPHLRRVNERIRVDGEEIADRALGERVREVLERYPRALEPGELTYFELGTLVALWHFAKVRVQVAVLETGLGGRLDATTAARSKVTAVTSISLDHVEVLGGTLQEIASEKAGIFKKGIPAVLSRQPPLALAVLERAAAELGGAAYLEGRDFSLSRSEDGLCYRGIRESIPKIELGLRGAHQLENAAVALACLELLGEGGLGVGPERVRQGLAAVRWPGRLEEVARRPHVVLDGAHNPGGAFALARALDELYPGREVHLVFGVLADKDYRAILRALLPLCASVQLAPVKSPRALPPERCLAEAAALCPAVRAHPTPALALAAATELAGEQGLVLVAGSLYLVGELRSLLLE